MTNGGVDRETTNLSDLSREERCRRLAVLDWANTPSARIYEEFSPVSWQTLSNYRETDEYKETAQTLREAWLHEVSTLPGTAMLKKRISQGMVLSINALIDILSGKSANKDKIGAARLMAQLDGRFLKAGDEEGAVNRDVDSIAGELLTAIKRQGERVN